MVKGKCGKTSKSLKVIWVVSLGWQPIYWCSHNKNTGCWKPKNTIQQTLPLPPPQKKKDRSQNSCCIGGWADKPGPRLPVRKQAGVEKYPPGTNFPKDTLQGNQSYVKANSGQSKTSKSSNQKVIKKMVKKILTQE